MPFRGLFRKFFSNFRAFSSRQPPFLAQKSTPATLSAKDKIHPNPVILSKKPSPPQYAIRNTRYAIRTQSAVKKLSMPGILQPARDQRRETSDERRETRDERRATRDERRATRDERRATRDERRETSDERRLYTISFSNSKAPKSSEEFSQNPLFLAFFCLFTAIFRKFFQFFSNFRTFRRTRKPAPFAPLDPEFPLPTHSPTPLT